MVAVVRNDAEGHKDHEEGTRAVTRMTSLIVSIKPWDEDGLQGYFARRDAPGTIMSDSLDLAAQIRLLFHVLKLSYDSIYSKAAAVTFLVCDICWTFPDEVQYIWRSKWTLAKVLYLIARYYALMYNFCELVGHISTVIAAGSVVFTQVADIIFIQRVYALYHRNNKILFFLVPLLLVEATLNIYSATLAANISEGGLVTPPNTLARMPSHYRFLAASVPYGCYSNVNNGRCE
ncbi:hypothetical protein NLJ89_g1808 [Agrocybe chaxingu]|uniref:DUF6533 domain-containing protein n=1 Tax=Agrocybe chaxingu TaxID=84603 RepID=A0A9W8MZC8_9AGAR|nr:hypothetical protein NLJ89_g1808 [Agrocybe chaxingu]